MNTLKTRRIASLNLCLVFALGLTVLCAPAEKPPLAVTYLANEGFLIAAGETKIIVDGLYREGVEGYQKIPPNWREKIETAQPPFDGVDLLLVSHFHADHFDSHAVGRHLLNNRDATLVSSAQVVTRLEMEFDEFRAVEDRVHPVLPMGGPVRKEISGIEVEIWRVTHGDGRFSSIENLGYLVTLGGKKILHIGDSVAEEADLKRFGWAEQGIDIALLPYWYLVDEQWKPHVKPLIGADVLIPMHIPLAEREPIAEQIRAAFPNAFLFTRPMETKEF